MQNNQHTPQVDDTTAADTTETICPPRPGAPQIGAPQTRPSRKAFVEPQISAPADVLAITKRFFFMMAMSGDGGTGFGGDV